MAEEQPSSSSRPTSSARPIPDMATWRLLLETYKSVKKDSMDQDDIALFEDWNNTSPRSGFSIAYEIKQVPGKGMGVFCTEFLPRGTCVWVNPPSGHFVTEEQWRAFLNALPDDLAKDVVDWAGVGDYQNDQAVYVNFSDAALMNHGKAVTRWEKLMALFSKGQLNEQGRANTTFRYKEGKWQLYTTRGIQAGEELLVDYSEDHDYHHELDWFVKIYDEYYPDTPHATELERWSRSPNE